MPWRPCLREVWGGSHLMEHSLHTLLYTFSCLRRMSHLWMPTHTIYGDFIWFMTHLFTHAWWDFLLVKAFTTHIDGMFHMGSHTYHLWKLHLVHPLPKSTLGDLFAHLFIHLAHMFMLDERGIHLGEPTHVVSKHIWGFQTLIYGDILLEEAHDIIVSLFYWTCHMSWHLAWRGTWHDHLIILLDLSRKLVMREHYCIVFLRGNMDLKVSMLILLFFLERLVDLEKPLLFYCKRRSS